MIEKGKVTDFHGLHVIGGLMVAHPIPSLASITAGLLILP
jgi:heme/copper-type cytochrome/quinol oxidase subunit 3